MFVRQGIVHFPDIPLLTINDYWAGTGDDAGKLLLSIDRGIWSRSYVIVGIDDYCYTIRGDLGTFRPIPLSEMQYFDGLVHFDSVQWIDSGIIHLTPDRGWVLDDETYGDGNYYAITWRTDGDIIAQPRGPWMEEETPPETVTMEIDWPRLQISRNIGTVDWYGEYVPATTHVHNPVGGEMTIGMPSWRATIDEDEIIVAKTNAKFEDPPEEGAPEYVASDGIGFVWIEDAHRYEMTRDGTLYYANKPTPKSVWTWTVDGGGTVPAVWNGWIGGYSTNGLKMFEVARLL